MLDLALINLQIQWKCGISTDGNFRCPFSVEVCYSDLGRLSLKEVLNCRAEYIIVCSNNKQVGVTFVLSYLSHSCPLSTKKVKLVILLLVESG